MTDDRHSAGSSDQQGRHNYTSAEAAAAGEDDAWTFEPIVDPDDTQHDTEVFEGDEDE